MTQSRITLALVLTLALALVASVLAQGPVASLTMGPTPAPIAPPSPTPSLAPSPNMPGSPTMGPVVSPLSPPPGEGMAPGEVPATKEPSKDDAFLHRASVATLLALMGGVAVLFA